MIRLAVFDIDRTLVAPGMFEIATESAAAIRKLRENGIKTVVASGRQMHLIPQELRDLEFDYYILSNGAYVADRDGKILHREYIDLAALDALTQELIARNHPMDIRYTRGKVSANPNCTMAEKMAAFWREKGIMKKLPPHMLQDIAPEPGELPVSCLACIPVVEQPWFMEHFPELDFLPVFEGPSCDINGAGISKATGMKYICGITGISEEETIAFGDDRNDLEMIAAAGIGVAMANGIQAVRDVADYVTAPCEELGVVKALEYFGLI